MTTPSRKHHILIVCVLFVTKDIQSRKTPGGLNLFYFSNIPFDMVKSVNWREKESFPLAKKWQSGPDFCLWASPTLFPPVRVNFAALRLTVPTMGHSRPQILRFLTPQDAKLFSPSKREELGSTMSTRVFEDGRCMHALISLISFFKAVKNSAQLRSLRPRIFPLNPKQF